jgi:hypothetical protein
VGKSLAGNHVVRCKGRRDSGELKNGECKQHRTSQFQNFIHRVLLLFDKILFLNTIYHISTIFIKCFVK